MKLKSELDLYRMIARRPRNAGSVLGIGDDCAIVKAGKGFFVITTDMIVENDHFSLDYFSPFEIGWKAMESNVSDIAAMGGAKPLYAFISIAVKPGTSAEFLRDFYRGIYASARRHGIDVLGGDTTHGALMAVNITLIGRAGSKKQLVLRSGAKKGDLIFVTGKLGASTAGLRLFLKGIKGHSFVKKKHTRPSCRMDAAAKVGRLSHAMEDVSDGLASEVRNICFASGAGAIIYADKVPIDARTKEAAKAAGEDALDYALFGGEDFELVYTVARKDRKKAEKYGTCVGEITERKGVLLKKRGKLELLERFGFDHFAV